MLSCLILSCHVCGGNGANALLVDGFEAQTVKLHVKLLSCLVIYWLLFGSGALCFIHLVSRRSFNIVLANFFKWVGSLVIWVGLGWLAKKSGRIIGQSVFASSKKKSGSGWVRKFWPVLPCLTISGAELTAVAMINCEERRVRIGERMMEAFWREGRLKAVVVVNRLDRVGARLVDSKPRWWWWWWW